MRGKSVKVHALIAPFVYHVMIAFGQGFVDDVRRRGTGGISALVLREKTLVLLVSTSIRPRLAQPPNCCHGNTNLTLTLICPHKTRSRF